MPDVAGGSGPRASHTASEPWPLFLLPGLSLNAPWSSSGFCGAGGALPAHNWGETSSLSVTQWQEMLGMASCGSLLWWGHLGQLSWAGGWSSHWSQTTKLKADRVIGFVHGVTCPGGQMVVTGAGSTQKPPQAVQAS